MSEAKCQCGALSVSYTAEPDFVIACNCKACQRRTGSPYGTNAYFRKDLVKTQGDFRTFVRVAESGRDYTSNFCPDCGTTVYWTLEMRPDHIGVATGCMESPPEPTRAIWLDAQQDWVSFPENWEQFPKGSPAPAD